MAKAAKRKPHPHLDPATDFGPDERARQKGGLEFEPVARDLRGHATQLRAKAKVGPAISNEDTDPSPTSFFASPVAMSTANSGCSPRSCAVV